MSVISDKINSNGETFTRADYNGVSILIRDKDGYVNVTKIAKDNGKQKHLDRYFKSDIWNDIINNFVKNSSPQKRGDENNKPFYDIKNVTNKWNTTPDKINELLTKYNISIDKLNDIVNGKLLYAINNKSYSVGYSSKYNKLKYAVQIDNSIKWYHIKYNSFV